LGISSFLQGKEEAELEGIKRRREVVGWRYTVWVTTEDLSQQFKGHDHGEKLHFSQSWKEGVVSY